MGGPICISDVIWLKTLIHWVESNRGVDHPKISAMTSWHWLISVTRNSRSLYYFILSHTHRYSYIYNNLQYLHTCWICIYVHVEYCSQNQLSAILRDNWRQWRRFGMTQAATRRDTSRGSVQTFAFGGVHEDLSRISQAPNSLSLKLLMFSQEFSVRRCWTINSFLNKGVM